ncbi:AAA family ATPase [Azospirillum sp. SYSU D00513]|uniref:ATP-dependent DNA helicase n=1 Tax=Azospirillum sp. SYSU D00513 TaxID=2812561 RepID=UPI001A956FFA|nr:AAA family ATPase [Azospirillum sp. SYSU D00513]
MLSFLPWRKAQSGISNSTHADTPTDEQFRAVKAIDAWFADTKGPQVFWLAGEAGTGKTRTTSFAIQHLKEHRKLKKYVVGAPTGKAAQVLRGKGVRDANTLHSLLYEAAVDEETGRLSFVKRLDGPMIDAQLIIADEGSMIGDDVARDMLATGRKILVVADAFQLPPVSGTGKFCSGVPDFELVEPHRTALDSPVIRLARLLRREQMPRSFGSVGKVHVLPLDRETQRLVVRQGTQAICGVHTVRTAYIRRIRALRGFDGPTPQPGERVICRRNSRDLGLFNGMTGTVLSAQRARGAAEGLLSLKLQMDGESTVRKGVLTSRWMFDTHYGGSPVRPRLSKSIMEFDYGSTITCHASQGSEFSNVTVVDDSSAFREAKWRWLYTAVTRSSEELVLLLRNTELGGNWRMPHFEDSCLCAA